MVSSTFTIHGQPACATDVHKSSALLAESTTRFLLLEPRNVSTPCGLNHLPPASLHTQLSAFIKRHLRLFSSLTSHFIVGNN